jgi:DNA polymerase-4
MSMLCLWVPHLPIQVALADEPQLAGRPFLVVGQPWDDARLLDASAPARVAGARAGQRLALAQSRCPQATVLPADPTAYQALHQALAESVQPHTHRVETMALGHLLADLAHIRNLEDKAAQITLARRVSRTARAATDLDVRLGLAPQRFTALQAARAATAHGWAVVLPGEARGFLAPLDLATLPAADELRRLHLLGLYTLGIWRACPAGPSSGSSAGRPACGTTWPPAAVPAPSIPTPRPWSWRGLTPGT